MIQKGENYDNNYSQWNMFSRKSKKNIVSFTL